MNAEVPPWALALHQARDYAELWASATRRAASSTWAEFGVWAGNSARGLLAHLPADGRLVLFDSFRGLPEPWERGGNSGTYQAGHFACTVPQFPDRRITTIVGLFADTLPLVSLHNVGLVHIDSDLYSSAATVLEYMTDRMAPECVLICDELVNYPNWEQGEYRAVMEWCEEHGLDVEWQQRHAYAVWGIVKGL